MAVEYDEPTDRHTNTRMNNSTHNKHHNSLITEQKHNKKKDFFERNRKENSQQITKDILKCFFFHDQNKISPTQIFSKKKGKKSNFSLLRKTYDYIYYAVNF
jgi:hypothetical protein